MEAIFVERKTNKSCFDTHHPFEDKRKLYEKEMLFNNKEMTLADLGSVVEVDTVNNTEYGSTKRASAMLVAIPKKRKAKFLDVLYSPLKTLIKGRFFTEENLKSIRPANGLSPKYRIAILGKAAKKNIKKGTPLNWDLID